MTSPFCYACSTQAHLLTQRKAFVCNPLILVPDHTFPRQVCFYPASWASDTVTPAPRANNAVFVATHEGWARHGPHAYDYAHGFFKITDTQSKTALRSPVDGPNNLAPAWCYRLRHHVLLFLNMELTERDQLSKRAF